MTRKNSKHDPLTPSHIFPVNLNCLSIQLPRHSIPPSCTPTTPTTAINKPIKSTS